MSLQDTFEGVFSLFWDYMEILKDWTFIVGTKGENNIDLYAGLENISGIKERLFTPFANGRVSIINKKIVRRSFLHNDNRTKTIKCVSFDTQTVSYIEQYYRKSEVPYPGFDEVLRILKGHKFAYDHFPYTMENLLFHPERKQSVEKTLFAYEMLCGANMGSGLLSWLRSKSVVSFYSRKDFDFPFRVKDKYKLVYLSLLKMSYIQLAHSKWPLNKKMSVLLEFMNNEACQIMQPELNLANLYFSDGSASGFFGKVHCGNKDILVQLKNMAWDLMHLRFMDYSATIFNTKKADALIPYFFTYDQRLQKVKKCYELQTLAINTRNHSVIPIYAIGDSIRDVAQDHCTSEMYKERMAKAVDLDQLILKCEQEVLKLAV